MSEYIDPAAWEDGEPGEDATGPSDFPSRSRRGNRLVMRMGGAFLAVALVAGTLGFVLGDRQSPPGRPTASPFPFGGAGSGSASNPFGLPGGFDFPGSGQGTSGGTSTSATIPAAVRSSEAALVDVDTTVGTQGTQGAGTGIVLTSGGLVLTNNHVINGATSISVTDLGNGRTYAAQVVGYDLLDDVAVLQLSGASGLTVARTSSTAAVGETAFAVGNAGGTGGSPTVTSGTITALDQAVTASDNLDGSTETLQGMLETSATLISGDSGGALTSSGGSVLGMDTAGSTSAIGAGQGFAIPIGTALHIAHEIIGGSTSPRVHIGSTAVLGVYIAPSRGSSGAQVQSVQPGSPAASAGIAAGSTITSVGGHSVATSLGLRVAMSMLQPGASVRVTWTDPAGATHSGTVVLGTGAAQ